MPTPTAAATKALLRDASALALRRRGYGVEPVKSRGIKTGSQLLLTRDQGPTILAQVKTTNERLVSSTRRPVTENWRFTQKDADEPEPLVIVAGPFRKDPGTVEVFAFASRLLARRFDEALAEMRRNGRDPSCEMPIFLPLDERTRKDTGHSTVGLKNDAQWTETITVAEVTRSGSDQTASDGADASVTSMKSAFAKLNDVEVADVIMEINFRIRQRD